MSSKPPAIKGAGWALAQALSGMVIPIHPAFVRMTGSLVAAYILRQIIHLSTSKAHADKDGWFPKSGDAWQEELGISAYQVSAAIKGTKKTTGLMQCGVETKFCKPKIDGKLGPAPMLHYRINLQVLENALATYYEFTEGKSVFAEIGQSKNCKDDLQETGSSYYIKSKESKEKDSPAADADGEPETTPLPESPTPVEPDQDNTVKEATDASEKDTPDPTAKGSGGVGGSRPRDELWELICLGSFGKHYTGIGAQSGRVGKIKKLLLASRPDLTPVELEAAYKHYAKENPDILRTPSKRLKSPDAILDWIQQAIDAGIVQRSDEDIRASAEWQAHRGDYEAYAAAFPEKTAQQILNEQYVGIRTYVKMHGVTS